MFDFDFILSIALSTIHVRNLRIGLNKYPVTFKITGLLTSGGPNRRGDIEALGSHGRQWNPQGSHGHHWNFRGHMGFSETLRGIVGPVETVGVCGTVEVTWRSVGH